MATFMDRYYQTVNANTSTYKDISIEPTVD